MKSPLDYTMKLMRAQRRPPAAWRFMRGGLIAAGLMLAIWWAGCTPHAINDWLTSGQEAESRPRATVVLPRPPVTVVPPAAPAVEDDLILVPTIRGSTGGGDLDDPYARLFRLQDEIARDLATFVGRLAAQLGPPESAHVTTLHRVYSTGQCVRELSKWLDEPQQSTPATAERRAELAELLRRWQQSEQLLVQLARAK